MPIFPSYAKIAAEGYSESDSPIVERSEMDRGVPKQRKTQSDVRISVSLKLLFDSTEDAISFSGWYYSDAGAGMVYFDWTSPIDGVTYQARAVANTLGAISSSGGGQMKYTTRTLQIEYLRPL